MTDTTHTISVGTSLVNFDAPTTSNLHFDLSKIKGKSNLVLYFYPKDSTPGCTTEGQDFRDLYLQFKELDTEVLGVSKDSMKRHENFKSKQSFPFELLCDENSEICEYFGTWQLKKTFGKEYMGIVRSTFLIDKKGIIQEKWDNVKVKGHAQDVLAATKKL